MISGVKFEWVSASQIQLTPDGVNGRALIPVWDGETLVNLELLSSLTLDISTSGAGGLDTGSEAASTGYDVYLVSEFDGANPALIAVTTGGTPTLPGSYTHTSELLWFLYNDGSSDIVDFMDLGGGACRYLGHEGTGAGFSGPFGIRIVENFISTTATALDFSEVIPADALVVRILTAARNNSTTTRDYEVALDSAMANLKYRTTQNTTANDQGEREYQILELPLTRGVDGSVYHRWQPSSPAVDPNEGTDVDVQGWRIRRP